MQPCPDTQEEMIIIIQIYLVQKTSYNGYDLNVCVFQVIMAM